MNAGARRADGHILLFLHADSTLPDRAFAQIEAVMSDPRNVAGAFHLGVDSRNLFIRFLCYTSSIRARLSRIPYGDQAIFIRTDYFRGMGGYRPIPLMEDVELMKRIKKRGDRIVIIKDRVVSSARRWHREGILYSWLRNHRLRLLYFLGVSAERLSKSYPDVRAEQCVIFFCRLPRRGRVKTRIARHFEGTFALELYRNFILDMLETIGAVTADTVVFVFPGRGKKAMQRWLGSEYSYKSQRGKDLGERMKNAFTLMFHSGYDRCILVGSDLPDLPVTFLNEAFHALTSHEAVIGPTVDGGYYLVGFRRQTPLPPIFRDIPWGTDRVWAATMAIFKNQSTRIYTLPRWRDMDTPEDLIHLLNRNHVPGHTGGFLRKNRQRIVSYRCLDKQST